MAQMQQIRNSQIASLQRTARESLKKCLVGRAWLSKLVTFKERWTVANKQQPHNGTYQEDQNQGFEERPKSRSIKQSARVTRTSENEQAATSSFTRYGRKVKPPDKFIA